MLILVSVFSTSSLPHIGRDEREGEKYREKVGGVGEGRGWRGGGATRLIKKKSDNSDFFRDPPSPPPPSPLIFSASIPSIHLSLYLYLYNKGTVSCDFWSFLTKAVIYARIKKKKTRMRHSQKSRLLF